MIEQRIFGRTGHSSSRVIFGAAALGAMRPERVEELLPQVLAAGVNHIDTAASYGDSELRLAPWLVDHRADVFLATKTGERDGVAARAELERSLERLGVDSVDLIQLHNLVELDQFETAHGPGGVVEAMAAARDEGLVRFIGVTGHGLRIAGRHLESLERFPFDSVLFPYNFSLLDTYPSYRRDVDALVERCVAEQVAMQTIKAVARRRWPDDSTAPKFSWYEPVDDAEVIDRAVNFVLGREPLFLNTTSDARLLPSIFAAAAGECSVPSDELMSADVLAQGITPIFDGGILERI